MEESLRVPPNTPTKLTTMAAPLKNTPLKNLKKGGKKGKGSLPEVGDGDGKNKMDVEDEK